VVIAVVVTLITLQYSLLSIRETAWLDPHFAKFALQPMTWLSSSDRALGLLMAYLPCLAFTSSMRQCLVPRTVCLHIL
jgi:hypothetical protein